MGGKGQAQRPLLEDDALPVQFVGQLACRKWGYFRSETIYASNNTAAGRPASRNRPSPCWVPREPLHLPVLPEPHDRARDVGRRDRSTRRSSGLVGVAPIGQVDGRGRA